MNHNKGCYRQPIAMPYRRPINVADFNTPNNVIHHHVEKNEHYDTCDTKEMNYKLGMVYSPYQEWQNIYCTEKGFGKGTIFAELDKPFKGYKCTKGVCAL